MSCTGQTPMSMLAEIGWEKTRGHRTGCCFAFFGAASSFDRSPPWPVGRICISLACWLKGSVLLSLCLASFECLNFREKTAGRVQRWSISIKGGWWWWWGEGGGVIFCSGHLQVRVRRLSSTKQLNESLLIYSWTRSWTFLYSRIVSFCNWDVDMLLTLSCCTFVLLFH